MNDIFDRYFEAISDLNKNKALKIIQNAIDSGMSPESIVFEVVVPGLERMVEAFVVLKEIAISRHYLATVIANDILDRLLPLFNNIPGTICKVILGCPSGDFHGLGKKIVGGCLRANRFEVVDLGINVPACNFVDAALEQGAPVIGISSMMVSTALSNQGARGIRKLLHDKKLENKIKIIVGGAPYLFDPELYLKVEADGWSPNGLLAVQEIKKLLGRMDSPW